MKFHHLEFRSAILITLTIVVISPVQLATAAQSTLLPEAPPVGHPKDRVQGGASRFAKDFVPVPPTSNPPTSTTKGGGSR